MQQAVATVIAMSSDDSDAVTADCQQLVDCSRAFAAACPRSEQLQTFLEDKVTQSPLPSAVNQLPGDAAPDTCSQFLPQDAKRLVKRIEASAQVPFTQNCKCVLIDVVIASPATTTAFVF